MKPLVSIRTGSGCLTMCRPQLMQGTQMRCLFGGRALAVRGGEWGALVSSDVEEGVEEEVSDTLPQGGRLEEGGCPDALGGARGVEVWHLLVLPPKVLPYCCGVAEGVGLGQCCGWWRSAWRGEWCGRGGGGALVVVAWASPGGRGKGDPSWCVSAGGSGGGGLWGSLCGVSVVRSPGRGAGGGWCGDGTAGCAGGQGLPLCWSGVWASRRVLWALCVCVVRVSQSLAGRGVEAGGGCPGIWVGLWFAHIFLIMQLCVGRLLPLLLLCSIHIPHL